MPGSKWDRPIQGRPWGWGDADNSASFAPSKVATKRYARQLTAVASKIAEVARRDPQKAEQALREYAEVIDPWARQAAATMVAGVRRKNDQAWRSLAGRMGLDVRTLLSSGEVGDAVRERIEENASLIRSMVIGAADQVGGIVRENMAAGSRAEDLAKRIERVGEVNQSRALTIARTEVSKAGTALTTARARSVGSTGYIWRTTRDGDTRESHRAMEGKFVEWDNPPTIDRMTGHAGEFPNCRCYPEPVIPRETGGVYASPMPTQETEMETGTKSALSQWEKQSTSHVIPHVPGAPLVNVERAKFDRRKLAAYSLDPEAADPRGRAKAVLFKKLLGADPSHADLIESQIMSLAPHLPAKRGKADEHGKRFEILTPVTGPNGMTVDVLSAWIYDRDKSGRNISTVPRLTSCYIPKKRSTT